MRINEVEEQLGIPKATIRFYEKQGLLSPQRGSNNYREYSGEDVFLLQNIVILRKLGISVQDIDKIHKGELSFQDAIQANIDHLAAEIGQLEGSLRLSRQIAGEGDDHLDTARYWRIIREQEAAGERFVDIAADFWVSLMVPTLRLRFHIPEGESIRNKSLWIFLGNILFALAKTFLWKDGGFLENFLYWPGIMLLVALLTFPIFWLQKKNHLKLAGFLWNLVAVVCFGVLVFFLLLLLYGLLFCSR